MGDISVIEFRFEHDKKTVVDAMRACSRSLTLSRGQWMHNAFGIFHGVVIFLGCAALVFLIFRAIGLWEFKEYIQFIVLLGLLVSYFVWTYYRERMAIQLLKSSLFLGEIEVVTSENEITISNPAMKWQLKWAAVDAILLFRSGLGLRLGNIVIPIPEHAIPSEFGLTQCRNQLEAWRKSAQ